MIDSLPKINDLVFKYSEKTDSFMVSSLKLLLSSNLFVKEASKTILNCRRLKNHYCCACGVKSLIESGLNSSCLDITRLKGRIMEMVQEKERITSTKIELDGIETLSLILNCFHSDFLGDSSEGLDKNILNTQCNEQCPFHKAFYLGMEETYTCRCGTLGKNQWDYSNLCLYFGINEVVTGINSEISMELLGIPDFRLKNNQIPGNSLNIQGKLLDTLQARFSNIQSNYCFKENCQFSSSKISLIVKHAPNFFLINLLLENSDLTHLQSLISTVFISHTLELSEGYGQGSSSLYNLKGIIFYGRGHFEYACRYNSTWSFPGLHESSGWFEVLKEITVMNYHPVCAVYKKGRRTKDFRIKNWKLLRLEKLACECDVFERKYKTMAVDGGWKISRLCLKPIRVKENPYDSMKREIGNMDSPKRLNEASTTESFERGATEAQVSDSKLLTAKISQNPPVALDVLAKKLDIAKVESIPSMSQTYEKKGWKCRCNATNELNWEVCQTCHELKPGLVGWVCKLCKFRNSIYSHRCDSCDSYKDTTIARDQTYWKCEICKTANASNRILCSGCYKVRFKDARGILKNTSHSDWKCQKCNRTSHYLRNECLECFAKREREKEKINRDWVCKHCAELNNELELVCFNCGKEEKKDQDKIKIVKKSCGVVDSECFKASEYHVFEEENKIWSVTLNQADLQDNANNFYIIQLLQSDTDSKRFFVWNRWGRVGYSGQNASKGPFADVEKAKSEYNKKLNDKTKGGYIEVQISYEEVSQQPVQKAVMEETKKEDSKLDARVRELIDLIFDLKTMNSTLAEIGYDAKKMPLGKLSVVTIKQGMQVLKDIEAALHSNNNLVLSSLSCKFYSLIPHDVRFEQMSQFILNTPVKLNEKIAMIESISYMKIANNIIESTSAGNNPVDEYYLKLKCGISPIERTDPLFAILETYARNTHTKLHRTYSLTILEIYELDKEGEDARFQKDLHNRMLLWHGSRLTNFAGILSQGLRIAPPEAPVGGCMFGKGVYFADMWSKSVDFCFTSRTSNTEILLLCDVALGNCNEKMFADYNSAVLPPDKHSTKGCGKTAPPPSSYVNLNGTKIPQGEGRTVNTKGPLLYNEYIVYDVSQVRMKYLFKMRFDYKP